jgi:transcriptional regulator with XRE-family HTH domain
MALKSLRIAEGWTQAALARRAGVYLASVRKAERGKNIRPPLAEAIAGALRKPLDTLFVSHRSTVAVDQPTSPASTPSEQPKSLLVPTVQQQATSSPSVWLPDPLLSPTAATEPPGGGAPRPEGLWFDPHTKKLWRMAKSIFLPISGEDLDMEKGRFGHLPRFEITKAALEETLRISPDLLMNRSVYEFLRDVWSHPKKYHSIISGRPALEQWVQNIWAPVHRGSKSHERSQLQNFYHAMQSEEIKARWMPEFTYEDVSCWRVFVQAFPESIDLLEKASRSKAIRYTQRMAVSLLSSTLAVTDDDRIAKRAAAVVRQLNGEVAVATVYSYRQYQVVRQFLYAAVEAGEADVKDFLDFLNNPHHPLEWEFRLNRGYYKDDTDASFALTIVRKCDRPFNRDERTKPISEYHREALPKKLVDKAYRDMQRPSVIVKPRS